MRVNAVQSAIDSSAQTFERHTDFEACIRSHYAMLLMPYSKRPFFYKSALHLSRLMVSFTLLSDYFSKPAPLLSEVKAFCTARGFCSKNSLESIFLVFRALGFMSVKGHPDDSRFRVFSPSPLACQEVRLMLNSVVEPLAVMCTEDAIFRQMRECDDRAFLELYFKGFSIVLRRQLTIDVLAPECHWLVKRDAGHLLMLAIYIDTCVPNNHGESFKVSSYLSLAKQISVSKTHVIRLVQEGADRGYFKVHSRTLLEVLPSFVSLVRRFMAYWFAISLHSIKLGQDECR
ncbi:hypothetical protein LRS56_14540 [Pseudomonas poae]|nr:hypothetical protein LRS56_14540 [Pseudomonas poae]